MVRCTETRTLFLYPAALSTSETPITSPLNSSSVLTYSHLSIPKHPHTTASDHFKLKNKILCLPGLKASGVCPLLLGLKTKILSTPTRLLLQKCPRPPPSPHLRQPLHFLSATQLHWPSGTCLLALCPMAFAHAPLTSCMINHGQSFRMELMCCFFGECPFRFCGKSLWVCVAFFPSMSLSLPLFPHWCENAHRTFSSVSMETTSIPLTAASM